MILYIIMLGLAFFIVGSFIRSLFDKYGAHDWEIVARFIAGVIIVILSITFLSIRSDSRDFLARYNATVRTIESARFHESLENAAVTIEIIKINQELGKYRRWANSQWTGYFCDNDIREINFIE